MLHTFFRGSRSKPNFLAVSATWAYRSRRRTSPAFSRPIQMLSAAENTSTSLKCWWTMPMPSRLASWGEVMVTGFPSTRICPLSGW